MAQAAKIYTYAAGQDIKSSEVNANENELITKYNAHDTATNAVHGVSSSEGAIVSTKKSQYLYDKNFVIDGFTGGGTAGKLYYVDDSGALQLFDPSVSDMWLRMVGFGTDTEGELIRGGKLSGFSSLTYPGLVYGTSSGGVTNNRQVINTGEWACDVGVMASDGVLDVHINNVNWSKF